MRIFKTKYKLPNKVSLKIGRSRRLVSATKKLIKLDVVMVTLLILVAGIVSSANMTGSPQRFEDEGTYISQAWAVKERGDLAHYTYWYDHPPAGWIQVAGYLAATNALDRYDSAISAGREFMFLLHILSVGLLYILARRLGMSPLAASLGTLAFSLSPLVVEFSRYILLDNVALPWMLAAFILALNPKRNLTSAVGSAACMAVAVLSKETFAVMLPVLIYALWQNGDRRNRRYTLTSFGIVFFMLSGLYLIYALLKNELFPGAGHVSLLGSLGWQIFERAGSGSVFDASSDTRGLIGYWLNIDLWLLLTGLICLPIAMFYKRLRIAALALLLCIIVLMRPGYLPYPYIIIVLPFAALVLAGVVDRLVIYPLCFGKRIMHLLGASTVAIVLTIVITAFVIPAWQPKLNQLANYDSDLSSRQAIAWIERNIDPNNRLVVESALWTDIQEKGFSKPDPVWLYKIETDPAVAKEIAGWRGIDYVILNGPTVGSNNFERIFPTVSEAVKNSNVVAEFGKDNQKILVYKVNNNNQISASSL